MISLNRDQHGNALSPSPRPRRRSPSPESKWNEGTPLRPETAPAQAGLSAITAQADPSRAITPPREIRHRVRGLDLEKKSPVAFANPEPEPTDSGARSPRAGKEAGRRSPRSSRSPTRKSAGVFSSTDQARMSALTETSEARKLFDQLDEDGSGSLDKREVMALAEKLGMKMSASKRRQAYDDMCQQIAMAPDVDSSGEVSFERFLIWFNQRREDDRRKSRRRIHDLFHQMDKDKSGTLDRDEIMKLVRIAKPQLKDLDPPFDIDADWKKMEKVKQVGSASTAHLVSTDEEDGEVSFVAFETWWKMRLGLHDQDIPVMPEYLVSKLEHTARRFHVQNPQADPRSAKSRWAMLRPKLRMLVSMQREWGEVHELYDSSSVSMFAETPLPPWVRHPESQFSLVWDLVQIIFLAYVGMVVPFRACFDVEIPFEFSFAFMLDNFVDIYFIVDLFLNFRTAYYADSGLLEGRPSAIVEHYFKGWFTIDFVSCLPVQYFDLAFSSSTEEQSGQDKSKFRALKALRLVRLSKMLRLARIKVMVQKYSNSFDFSQNIGVVFVLLGIFFLAHMLACFWYLAGTGAQVGSKDTEIDGWVIALENSTVWDEHTPLFTRYVSRWALPHNLCSCCHLRFVHLPSIAIASSDS